MAIAPAPTQSGVFIALRSFLLAVLPAGIEVVQGQGNRVPEPSAADYVLMTAMGRRRLGTNNGVYADCAFYGVGSETALEVVPPMMGVIIIGADLFGVDVAPGTTIVRQASGVLGGPGTYVVSSPLPHARGATVYSTGAKLLTQPTEFTIQLDVHGPASSDNVQTISTLLRDDYSVLWFERQGFENIVPLYAGEPRQAPFINAESEYEDRWTVDAVLQVNHTIAPPQQFAGRIDLNLHLADGDVPTEEL